MSSVVVVGSANVDLVVRAPRHPVSGETLLGSGFATHPGGKGANQAVAAARAGIDTAFIGRLGDDAGAILLRAALTDDAIDSGLVGTCRHDPTGTALITVADSGDNTIVVVPGANGLLRPVHVDDAEAAGVFDGCAVVLAQLEIPIDAVIRAFTIGRRVGAVTVLNAAPMTTLPPDLLAVVDLLVVNETELGALVPDAAPEAALSAAAWGALGSVRGVVITVGERGVHVQQRDEPSLRAPGHHIEVVDTTAAGDTFCGVLAAALADGRSIEVAIVRANAAAALACTRPGAQPSIPTMSDVDAFLAGSSTS